MELARAGHRHSGGPVGAHLLETLDTTTPVRALNTWLGQPA
jgi:hypothetical protein